MNILIERGWGLEGVQEGPGQPWGASGRPGKSREVLGSLGSLWETPGRPLGGPWEVPQEAPESLVRLWEAPGRSWEDPCKNQGQ